MLHVKNGMYTKNDITQNVENIASLRKNTDGFS